MQDGEPNKPPTKRGKPAQHEHRPGGLIAFKIIFTFTRKTHLFYLIPALFCAALSGLFKPVISILTGRFFNSFSLFAAGKIGPEQLTRDTSTTIYGLLGTSGAIWLVKGGFCCAWITYGESQAKAVREDLFSTLLLRDLAWFEKQEAGLGTLLSRIQSQIRDFQLGVSQPLGLATVSGVQAAASLAVAFYHNWKLSLVLLAAFPIIVFVLSSLARGLQKAIEEQQEQLTYATKHANHAITHISLLKCHNAQATESTEYGIKLQAMGLPFRKQAKIAAAQSGFMRFAGSSLVVLALFYGNNLVHNADADAGDVLTTFWCCTTATSSINEILTQILVLERGRAAASALKSLIRKLGEGQGSIDQTDKVTPSTLEGDIEFRDVSFAYPARPDHEVLRNTTFFFPAHETTYVVGKSGSGKSTLSTLLLKLYTVTNGEVMIDGNDIRSIDTSWLRNNVTLVQQDSILFNDTIFSNITICNNNASAITPARISDLLAFSTLEETICNLTDGVYTKVGKGGASLSGGQRQRIALARARLRDTPVLILDESTSALDDTAKVQIMHNIREWRQDKTTIVITHDLSQIRSGDFMYILKDGQVIAEGYRSAVEAELERTQNSDMIGTPLAQLQVDQMPSTKLQGRTRRVIPRQLFHMSTNHSMSSIDTLAHDGDESEDVELLSPATASRMGTQRGRKSRRTLLPFSVTMTQNARSEQKADPEMSDTDYDMSYVSTSRKLHNRLTIMQPPGPLGVGPSMAGRPFFEQQDVVPPMPMHPITIWDNTSCPSLAESPVIEQPLPHREDNAADHIEAKTNTMIPIGRILMTAWSSLGGSNRSLLAIAFTSASCYAVIPSVSGWLMVKLFQTVHQPVGWVEDARKWSLLALVAGCLDMATAFTIHLLFEVLSSSWANLIRCEAFRRLLLQPKAWFDADEASTTEICNVLDKAAEQMRDLFARFVPFVLIAVIMMIVAILWCLATCWKLTLVALACIPVPAIMIQILDVVSAKWESRTADAAEAVSDVFAESFSDIRTVRALTLESHFHRQYIAKATQAFSIGVKRSIYIGICFGASDATIPSVVACIFTYGTKLAKTPEFTLQEILSVFTILLISMTGASSIISFIPQASSGVDAGSRLLRLAWLPTLSHEQQGDLELEHDNFEGKIEFCDLTFSYPTRSSLAVLKNLSVTIEAGQCVALVGRSGCGKSTLISLILGLYAVDEKPTASGALKVSGHAIDTLKISSLRSLIAYTPQQPVLFAMSIRSNILYGLTISPGEGQDLVELAARQAGIHEFITSLPSGYDTNVGDGGLGVSGGQAQRIVLARAFARRPRLLLMDEPTSALDGESTEVVKKSIRDLRCGDDGERPTVVIVTHSRDMMRLADKVVMLENGNVVEEGVFSDLMERRESLWRMLSAGEE